MIVGRLSLPLTMIAVFALVVSPASAQRPSTFKLREPAFLRSFRPVVEDAHRSVVRFERFDERDQLWVDAALGVVVDSDGYVLSKSSELFGTLRASLALYSNVDADVIKRDSVHDVALVRIAIPKGRENTPLEPVVWSDKPTEVGRWVVTAGIDRLPAAVGVVSVPERLIAPSNERPYLGVLLEMSDSGSPKIRTLARHSAADRAGLRVGDVIRKVNNRTVGSVSALQFSVAKFDPGDDIEVTITRDGESQVVRVTLQHIPPMSDDPDDPWNDDDIRSRWSMMNELGSRLSTRRANFPKAIQHDTVLRPEDCGGIALNLDGTAVGLNIARSGRTESLMLPAATVRILSDRLLSAAKTEFTSTAN